MHWPATIGPPWREKVAVAFGLMTINMAYLIFSASSVETERRELHPERATPLIIGRAPDCDIPVPDILLSRHHCRLEIAPDAKWVVLDLGSKNGTYLSHRQISRHILTDGDELRLGPRTRVTFCAGAFEANPRAGAAARSGGMSARPADPHEALAGTVSGFVLVEPGEAPLEAGTSRSPRPQPRPLEPAAYRTEDVYGMLSELMSSSWDSIKEQASKPIIGERTLPRAGVCAPPMVKRKPAMSMCLQAESAAPEAPRDPVDAAARADTIGDSIAGMTVVPRHSAVAPAEIEPISPIWLADIPSSSRLSRRGWLKRYWRRPTQPGKRSLSSAGRRQLLLAMVTVVLTVVFVMAWTTAVWLGPRQTTAALAPKPARSDSSRASVAVVRVVYRPELAARVYGPPNAPSVFVPETVLFAPTAPLAAGAQAASSRTGDAKNESHAYLQR